MIHSAVPPRRLSRKIVILGLLVILIGLVGLNILSSTAIEGNAYLFRPRDGDTNSNIPSELSHQRFTNYFKHSSEINEGMKDITTKSNEQGEYKSRLDLSNMFSPGFLRVFGQINRPREPLAPGPSTNSPDHLVSIHRYPADTSKNPDTDLSYLTSKSGSINVEDGQNIQTQHIHRDQVFDSVSFPSHHTIPPLPYRRPAHAASSIAARRDPTAICTDIVGMGISHCVAASTQLQGLWKVYLVPQDAPSKGFRFHHLIDQGLNLHHNVERVNNPKDAHVIIFLSTSTKEIPIHNVRAPDGNMRNAFSDRLVVLDEGDGPGHIRKVKNGEYIAYFKRSWVRKSDGAFLANPIRFEDRYYPMTYSVSNNYTSGVFYTDRTHEIVCTLRKNVKQPARARILEWVAEIVQEHSIENISIVGEVNHAQRRTIDKAYLEHNRNAKIVVTCNPSFWDGDFRTWEAMASGALVFVDQMHVPVAYPLIDGVHLIIYDNHDRETFRRKLR